MSWYEVGALATAQRAYSLLQELNNASYPRLFGTVELELVRDPDFYHYAVRASNGVGRYHNGGTFVVRPTLWITLPARLQDVRRCGWTLSASISRTTHTGDWDFTHLDNCSLANLEAFLRAVWE